MFYFHPYLGKISISTSILIQMGRFNHQPPKSCPEVSKRTSFFFGFEVKKLIFVEHDHVWSE